LFYGHNYGVKNLRWAIHTTLNHPDPDIVEAFKDVKKIQSQGFASTGIPFSQEMKHNLYFQAITELKKI